MPNKLKSRKLWAAIATALVVVANQVFDFGLKDAATTQIVAVIITYLVAQGYVDGK